MQLCFNIYINFMDKFGSRSQCLLVPWRDHPSHCERLLIAKGLILIYNICKAHEYYLNTLGILYIFFLQWTNLITIYIVLIPLFSAFINMGLWGVMIKPSFLHPFCPLSTVVQIVHGLSCRQPFYVCNTLN